MNNTSFPPSDTPRDASPAALAAFLRACRERLQPGQAGLPAGARRRAPGLRREEVAQLAGISTTWYTWIEQGRSVVVSPRALAALADALRLSQAERGYLFDLAAAADPSRAASASAAAPSRPALQPLVDAVRTPAYVLDRHWDAVAWNAPAARLFADWLGPRPAAGRNLLRYVFLAAQARSFIADWEERAERLVAEYRADTAGGRGDAVGRALVDALCRESPAFATAWGSQRVLAREGGLRRFRHARQGDCAYAQFTLAVAPDAASKLVVLVPAKPAESAEPAEPLQPAAPAVPGASPPAVATAPAPGSDPVP